MSLTFRPTAANDLVELRSFLATAFDAGMESPFLDPGVMAWKYWDRRNDWEGPRSYVLEKSGRIVAHAGVWPMSLGKGTDAVTGMQMIDWASDKATPGAGASLVSKLASRFDFIYSIGGSDATRKILPAFGFSEFTREWHGVRPLRPLAQILTHQVRSWKLFPRLVRNGWLSLPRSGDPGNGWEAIPISPSEIEPRLSTPGVATPGISPRTSGFFEYLARCPAAPFTVYRATQGKVTRGHLAISVVRQQARLVGAWLHEPSRENWAAACAIARRVAHQIADANEIIVAGTDTPSREGAQAAGYLVKPGHVVYLLDKKRRQPLPRDFQFQLSDYDAAFLDVGTHSYWS